MTIKDKLYLNLWMWMMSILVSNSNVNFYGFILYHPVLSIYIFLCIPSFFRCLFLDLVCLFFRPSLSRFSVFVLLSPPLKGFGEFLLPSLFLSRFSVFVHPSPLQSYCEQSEQSFKCSEQALRRN